MKKINIDILESVVFVHKTNSIKTFLSKYGGTADEHTNACVFFDEKDPEHCIQVVFKEEPDKKSIVHESVHIVNMLFKERGILPDLDNDELQAYLTAFLFEKMDKIVSKQ
jgi:hypothetical protein